MPRVAGCAPRSRTFRCARSGARLRLAPDRRHARRTQSGPLLEPMPRRSPGSGSRCSRLCKIGHGTDLVRADLHPAARAGTRSSSPIPIQSVVGPTGRGITGDIVTLQPPRRPSAARRRRASRRATARPSSRRASTTPSSSTAPANTRSARSSSPASGPIATTRKGAERGKQVAFVVELDGVHTIHLGEIGHLLTEEKLADIGSVDIACVPVGGTLSPARPRRSSPSSTRTSSCRCRSATRTRRLREALAQVLPRDGRRADAQPKLSVTATSLPAETTTVLLESRGKVV